jgi:hypothetical protein
MDNGDGGGTAINLTVRQVTVQPVRAHVGDAIDIEVWIDNREDGSDTTWAEVYANKKPVAKQMFRWGNPAGDRTTKLNIRWDTRGMAPGEYKVKVEAFVFNDISPFDNELALAQPVVLVEPGGKFPGGERRAEARRRSTRGTSDGRRISGEQKAPHGFTARPDRHGRRFFRLPAAVFFSSGAGRPATMSRGWISDVLCRHKRGVRRPVPGVPGATFPARKSPRGMRGPLRDRLRCGTGSQLLPFAAAGVACLGFDPDPSLVAIARSKLAAYPGARVEEGAFADLPRLASSPADLLLCLGNSLVHVPAEDASRFLSDAAEALFPDGSILLQILNYERLFREARRSFR